jgi:hypothetical protein
MSSIHRTAAARKGWRNPPKPRFASPRPTERADAAKDRFGGSHKNTAVEPLIFVQRMSLFLAHRDISLPHYKSVAFGGKRAFSVRD